MNDDPRPAVADLLRRLADDDESRLVAAITDSGLVLEQYTTRRRDQAALLPPQLADIALAAHEVDALVRGLVALFTHRSPVIAASAASSVGYGGLMPVVDELIATPIVVMR